MIRFLFAASLVVSAGGCWSAPAEAAPLSLEAFFNGALKASGTVENLRSGTNRDFTIDMHASWTGPRGTLVEDVAYSDGERERKIWTFDKTGPGRFAGRRADVIGEAEVVEDQDGVRMSYKANTPVPGGLTLGLSFDDHLTPDGPGRVSVRSDITYLFVSAARITMSITKSKAK